MFSMKRGTIIPKITRTTMLFLVNYYGRSRTATFSFPLKAFTFFFCLLMLRHFIKGIEWKVVNQSKYSNLTTMKSIKLKNSYDLSLIRKKVLAGWLQQGYYGLITPLLLYISKLNVISHIIIQKNTSYTVCNYCFLPHRC